MVYPIDYLYHLGLAYLDFSLLTAAYLAYYKGLNMFLVPINIPTFRFSPSKIFLQLL